MKKSIPYGKHCIDQDDIDEIIKILKSDFITQGPAIDEFEKMLVELTGARFAVAVSSGTAALHLACLAIGVKKGDEVISTPNTFAATTNAVVYCGGTPLFADIDPDTFNIDSSVVKELLKNNPKVRGIIPVHFAGLPVEMERIAEMADKYNQWVIEDGCHAIGGSWKDSSGNDHKIGSCSHSDMTIFSFHPVKQITTGEGGAILTNNEKLYQKLKMLRHHGITKEPDLMTGNDGGWFYEMQELGYNYRITDLQAVLGISQLKKLDRWKKRRQELVQNYDMAFKSISEIRAQNKTRISGDFSFHLYVIQAENRNALYRYLKDAGILAQVHYIPVHLHPYYQNTFGFKTGDFPKTEKYYLSALSLPLYQSLTDEDQDYVIKTVRQFYGYQ